MTDFRYVILVERAIRGWKEVHEDSKRERKKKDQKDKMWKKANGWLNEYAEQKKKK